MAASTETPLGDLLAARTVEGELYEKLEGGAVRCFACGHRCRIQEGRPGVCRIRFNEGGVLRVPRGYVAGLQLDPIEKKPFFHAYPGAKALSFGMLGCDYKCGYCQNWFTSQALRDPASGSLPHEVTPEQIVELAVSSGARVVTSTYNEPLITSEWAVEVFRVAKREGLVTSYVSNGNGTPEVLDYIEPWVDLYKVDLKSFDPKSYRLLGGRLEPVLETIRDLHRRGIWLEVLTLVVPGFNSSDEELTRIAEFIASVGVDVPWHVTAFHKDYKMTGNDDTDVATLVRAWEIGRRAGLRWVYPGNIPGAFGEREGTHCPNCAKLLIGRIGFRVTSYALEDGACPDCGTRIPGRW
ncbi:MAG TPA: AmmeMemoRadiSam system radical SAM enzyme [Thermoanaerobaculia bacterium]|nr:AmmeMemoRadiSam system radical SAM enzyme [Thermoanaerobaculia bacterium]